MPSNFPRLLPPRHFRILEESCRENRRMHGRRFMEFAVLTPHILCSGRSLNRWAAGKLHLRIHRRFRFFVGVKK